MAMQKSTPEELQACKDLVDHTAREIAALRSLGKKVHVIWDVDRVLVSGRSDDVFTALGFSVEKYFEYEERLIAQRLEDGPWASLARACGRDRRHGSQDIVTARSSFLQLRVHHFLLNWRIPVRWMLAVGHQSKDDSYRIILKSFLKDPDMHVFMVDDAQKHVDAFIAVAKELGMTDRCHAVLSPTVRTYDQEEIDREIALVLDPSITAPKALTVVPSGPGSYGRHVMAVPDGRTYMRAMFSAAGVDVHISATVNANREMLEKWADEVWPGKKHSDWRLYQLLQNLLPP